jgi:hypothetical protein
MDGVDDVRRGDEISKLQVEVEVEGRHGPLTPTSVFSIRPCTSTHLTMRFKASIQNIHTFTSE